MGWAERAPRGFAIRPKDLETHGPSGQCPGCRAMMLGTARRGHSEACRARFEKAMKGQAKVVESKTRAYSFLSTAISEGEKRRKTESGDGMAVDAEVRPGGASGSGLSDEQRLAVPNADGELVKRAREGDGDERADEDIQEHKRQAVDEVMCINGVAEENTIGVDWAVDDVNGEFGVYEEAGTDECWARTGKAPITTK